MLQALLVSQPVFGIVLGLVIGIGLVFLFSK